jgi:site-specific DNA-adenine methylase
LQDKLAGLSMSFQNEGAVSPIHRIHPYFASFHPSIPRGFIQAFTSKGEVVLDPFCGSGTTLVEAKLLERNAIGIDVNPLASLISKVKTCPLGEVRLQQCLTLLKEIKEDLNFLYGQSTLIERKTMLLSPDIPDFRNKDYWFTSQVLNELGTIKAHVGRLQDKDVRDFCMVALSSIIVRVSNQQHETRYKRVDKRIRAFEVYERFRISLIHMMESMKEFDKAASNSTCRVFCEDLRSRISLKNEEVDLVVTSPPYLNAWDYNLYQKFRFYWLGFDHLSFKNSEIGAHLKHSYMNNSVRKYIDDMRLCLLQIHRVLKKGACCCIVVGEAFVQGKRVSIGEILVKMAEELSFSLEKIYEKEISGPHFSQTRSAGNKLERIIILSKR